uniref:Uncharacterized protein n=1 Tax=viral metagenome TaxID=1070528 RepID=A0A6M3K3M4_9ZZZZ
MKILCDVDGVIANYDFPAITKEFFGVAVSNEDIHAYSLEDVLGLPRQVVHHMFLEVCQRKPRMVSGAYNALKAFIMNGIEVYIYTNRLQFMTVQGLITWLQQFNVPFSGIAVFNERNLNTTFDFHIDDSPQKLMDVNGHVKRKLLFDQPWNRKCRNILGTLERVSSWKEIEQIVREEHEKQIVPASLQIVLPRAPKIQRVDDAGDGVTLGEEPRLRPRRRPPRKLQEGGDDSGALPKPAPV